MTFDGAGDASWRRLTCGSPARPDETQRYNKVLDLRLRISVTTLGNRIVRGGRSVWGSVAAARHLGCRA